MSGHSILYLGRGEFAADYLSELETLPSCTLLTRSNALELPADASYVVDLVLLDNMPNDDLRAAVRIRDKRSPGVELEASGGVTLETVGEIAACGVDRVSVGALTHSAPALDFSLYLERER